MPTTQMLAATPRYVLMDGTRRIGPSVVNEAEFSSIYGFSDKGPYDKFCTNSDLLLTPYPLVKTYLQIQANSPNDGPKMVVIDASRPQEPCLFAATMRSILEAQDKQTAQVAVSYRLVFDQQAEAYNVEEL